MADAKPPSTSDLLQLMTGLQIVKTPDTTANSGEDYYLNPPVQTRDRTLRETVSNPKYLNDPFDAWRQVRFRDWLISKLFAGITDNKHDFTAISEPVLYSMDLLGKKYEIGAPGVSSSWEDASASVFAGNWRDRRVNVLGTPSWPEPDSCRRPPRRLPNAPA